MSMLKEIKGQYITTNFLQEGVEFKELTEGVELTVRALTPGTYTGIDGATVNYGAEVIERDLPMLLGQQVKWFHSRSTLLVVGLVKGLGVKSGDAFAKLMVHHPDAVTELKRRLSRKERISVSLEAFVRTSDLGDAEFIQPLALAIILEPRKGACPSCVAIGSKAITLEELSACQYPGLSEDEQIEIQLVDVLLRDCKEFIKQHFPEKTDTEINEMCKGQESVRRMQEGMGACIAKARKTYPNETPEQLRSRCKGEMRGRMMEELEVDITKLLVEGKENSEQSGSRLSKDSEKNMSTQTTNEKGDKVSPQIQKLMDQCGLDKDKAMLAAGILGYSGGQSFPKQLESGNLAPLTQDDAVAQINTQYGKITELEKSVTEKDDKIKKLEEDSTTITKERDDLKKEHEDLTKKMEDIHTKELEALVEKVKAVDEDGKFLKTLEGMEYTQKKSILETFLETKPMKEVTLSRDNTQNSEKQAGKTIEGLFGESEKDILARAGVASTETGGNK